MNLRKIFVCGSIGVLFLTATVVHADAIQDLLDALQPPGSVAPHAAVHVATTSTLSIPTAAVVSTSTATEAEQIASLQQLIVVLTQQLSAILASKKGTASTSTPTIMNVGTTTDACAITRPLGRGMRGVDVTALQNFLFKAGVLDAAYVTGVFATLTETALQIWQSANGIIDHGSPSTTGYGFVGAKTRDAIQKSCTSLQNKVFSTEDAMATSTATNEIEKGSELKNVHLYFEIQGTSFSRRETIPVKIVVFDPVPYSGAYLDFIEDTLQGDKSFGSKVYLPVGFTGQVTHELNASHVTIVPGESTKGKIDTKLRVVIETNFRRADLSDTTKSFGQSDWKKIQISEDDSVGKVSFLVQGVSMDLGVSSWGKYIRTAFLTDPVYTSYFTSTSTSRANAIEHCDIFSDILIKNSTYSCLWNDEDVSINVRQKSKTILLTQ